MSQTVGDLISKYIAIRDKKKEIQERHKEELAPLNTALQKLEDYFQKTMDANGLENLKAGGGTAYKAVVNSVTVADWDAFREYVEQNGCWHMLDKRANKTAVMEVVEDTGELPPGLNLQRSVKINVRRD